MLLKHGHTHFFGGARVNGGLVNDHIASFQGLTHGGTGLDQWRHVGSVGIINRGGHCDDEHLRLLQVGRGATEAQLARLGQFFGATFQSVVFAALQLRDALGVDVEPNYGPYFAEFNC